MEEEEGGVKQDCQIVAVVCMCVWGWGVGGLVDDQWTEKGTRALLDLQQAVTLSPIVYPPTPALSQAPDRREHYQLPLLLLLTPSSPRTTPAPHHQPQLKLSLSLSRQLPLEWKVFQSTMPMLSMGALACHQCAVTSRWGAN